MTVVIEIKPETAAQFQAIAEALSISMDESLAEAVNLLLEKYGLAFPAQITTPTQD